MYTEKVMDHFMNPRNVGEIPDADAVGEVGNAKCGDIMRIYLKIDNDVITDIKFKTFGCGAAVATSSMATEMVKGKTIDEALELTNRAVIEALDGCRPQRSTVPCSQRKRSSPPLRITCASRAGPFPRRCRRATANATPAASTTDGTGAHRAFRRRGQRGRGPAAEGARIPGYRRILRHAQPRRARACRRESRRPCARLSPAAAGPAPPV